MTFWTFREVRREFRRDASIQTFPCIANPYNRKDCPNELWPERVKEAAELLRRAEFGLNLDGLRNIINCLLCVDCQRTNTHKDKVEKKWNDEFPEFDFSRRRSPSPYSLASGRRSGRQSLTPSRSDSRLSSTPLSERRLSPNYLATPPPRPYFTSARRDGRAADAETIPTPELSPSSPGQAPANDPDTEDESDASSASSITCSEVNENDSHPPSSPSVRSVEVVEHDYQLPPDTSLIDVRNSPGSPSARSTEHVDHVTQSPSSPLLRSMDGAENDTRPTSSPSARSTDCVENEADSENGVHLSRPPSNRNTEEQGDGNMLVQATLENPNVPLQSVIDVPMLDVGIGDDRDEVIATEDSEAGLNAEGTFETTAPPEAPNPFVSGEASTWAPWVIRDEVLSILLEPLPKPKSKGTLYAVRVTDTPYLKIGYTMKKVRDRIRDISRQHHVSLETNGVATVPGVPYLQLLRLEALVHADLAYFQRNLRVSGRVHREYFEVDLVTAHRSMQNWWRVMQDLRLEPGRELDDQLCEEIRANPALDIEKSDDQITQIPPEHWSTVNTNHVLREGVWKTVFKLGQGGIWKSHAEGLQTKVIAAMVSLLFLAALDPPAQMFFIAVAGSLFAFAQRML